MIDWPLLHLRASMWRELDVVRLEASPRRPLRQLEGAVAIQCSECAATACMCHRSIQWTELSDFMRKQMDRD